MRKYILILLLIFISVGYCYAIPYKEVALRYYNSPYDIHTNNCLHKAMAFHNFLISKGIKSRLVIGRFKNEEFYRHAWLEYWQDNEWYCIDLTDNPRTWDKKVKYYYWLKGVNYYYGNITREDIE